MNAWILDLINLLSVVLFWWQGGFPSGAGGKESVWQCRRCKRWGFDPWVGKSPGGGNGTSLQYSCLGNLMERGTWQATVHAVSKSGTWLSIWAPSTLFFEGRDSYSFVWNKFLCLLILLNILCLYEFRWNSYLFQAWRGVLVWKCHYAVHMWLWWKSYKMWARVMSSLNMC